MMNIKDILFPGKDMYLNPQNKTTESVLTDAVENSAVMASKQVTGVPDRITLSPEIEYSKTRERLGLPPTGRLTLNDFKNAIDSDKTSLSKTVESNLEKLGISPDTPLSLSLDDSGNIVVNESFNGKASFEKTLNDDADFIRSFKRLSANQAIFNGIISSPTGIMDLNLLSMSDESTSQSALAQIAVRYDALRSAKNPLAVLAQYGNENEAYTFTYDPVEKTTSNEDA